MATECTQESVLDFLLENGGRVKNKVLVERFRVFLSSDNTKRALLKERFKRFVDNIAYVKQEDGEKVVCLKKKHREMRSARAQGGDKDLDRGMNAIQFKENDGINGEITRKHDLNQESEATSDANMNVSDALCISDIALTERNEQKSRENINDTNDLQLSDRQSTAKLDSRAGESPHTSQIRRRTSRGSQRSLLLLLASSEDAQGGPGDAVGTDGTPKGSRKTFIELMKSSSPQVRRSLVHRTSQEHISATYHSSSVDEDCACVTLDPLEHEWMVRSADGEWDTLRRLLGCEPTLILKKDFVTGFTCLHWAAKQGKHELLATLVNFAKQHDVAINLNARSSAGYTPLHLAAIHNRIEVMKLLVGAYDVDVDARDYNGKKAAQYLRATVTGDIKDIIGACGSADAASASGVGRWWLPKVLPSNLNPLRLLNPPEEPVPDGQVKPRALYRKSSIGRRLQRTRFKTQIVHSTSFRENDERDDALKSPVKTRPMSNLFG
ncbi:ankyrin repeat domain-containing protein SOWAHC [Triplophysa rosa]|uniref:Ankyrin repeat domain-containing protein SOWAHC n=1 Tax=Triplophysa rosa TaxID=992332 RepID=A0A9W7WUV2_TRIRA|nr:ankyrin repeat domain-containing protein SOWAHC [Triplophysa rosa]KAI7808621.1 putative ankyrin repeat domain-containing protein SOWAHC [Triplophysa rosa]